MRRPLALAILAISCAPSVVWAASGTCTATTDGNVDAVTWTGANCSDLNDNCATCPDSDDSISVGTHAVTFNISGNYEHMNSVGDGATILFKTGTVSSFKNADDYGHQSWAKAGGWFIVEPGATVKMATSSNGVCGRVLTGGHMVIQGRVLQETTVSGNQYAGIVDGDTLNLTLADAVPDAQAGDVVRFLTGPAMAMTFRISDPRPVAGSPNVVQIQASPTDAHHTWGVQGISVDSVDKRKVIQASGDNLVSSNDQYYLGKFMWDAGSEFYPIVAVDESGAATDTFWSYYPVSTSFEQQGSFIAAYGFENGGDRVYVERPARVERSTGGAAGACRFACDDTAKCTIAHAVFDGVGIQAHSIDNANRPSEFFDAHHLSLRVGSVPTYFGPLVLGPDGTTDVCANITLDYIEVFGDSRGILEPSGDGTRLTHSVFRDGYEAETTAMKIQRTVTPDPPLIVEDSNFLRVGSIFAGSGQGTASRFPATFRRVWGVGTGRASNTAMGIAWVGTTLDPRTLTPDDKNSGKHYVFDSVLMSYGSPAFVTTPRAVGQRTYAVNSIAAYSGNNNPNYAGGIGSGSGYNSVITRNVSVGAKATTSLIGSMISLNGAAGIAGDSRRCDITTCAPTPGTRRILGNLSYGNTGPAMRILEHTADTDVQRNTLVDSTTGSPVVLFSPVDPDDVTGDSTCTANGSQQCGPTASPSGRPAWWSAFPVPSGGPKTTLKDNLIGNAPAGQSVINKGGTWFTNDDLLATYNLYWRGGGNGDKGTLDGAGTGELLNQADPFVSASTKDYRPTTITPGSTGTNRMGASWVGPLVDPATLPGVYKMIIDAGEKMDQRSGDIEPVNPETGTAADFLPDFTMTGKRVAFTFPSAPTMPANACANPTDKGEKCGTLLLRLYRTDDVVYPAANLPPKSVRVPVQGSGKTYSVSESAIALAFAGMADRGNLDIALKIGTTESPHDIWDWSAGYAIPRYQIPSTGGGSKSRAPAHPGGRPF